MTLAPGWNAQPGTWSNLRIANLHTGRNNQLIVTTDLTSGASDRLLIASDLQQPEGQPLWLQVNLTSSGTDSDRNHNGRADNTEGVSLMQIGGRAHADSVQLAGHYVARGAWAYGLYPFAPGRASAGQRLIAGEGNQYWDYRLQNILLAEEDNRDPRQPAVVMPQSSDPQSEADLTSAPEHRTEEQPLPLAEGGAPALPSPGAGNIRPAVIPQVPAYLSLPAALNSMSENLRALFIQSAQQAGAPGAPELFVSRYSGDDRYHSDAGFMDYGYDFRSRYQGWSIGSRLSAGTPLAFSAALHKGNLSLTPEARDGVSHASFHTLGIDTLLDWQQPAGLQLQVPFALNRLRGTVNTDMRGQVARIKAHSSSLGIESGWRWQAGTQAITPLAAVHAQWLHVNDFTDSDQAQVRYRNQTQLQLSTGVQYEVQPVASVKQGSDVRYVQHHRHHSQVLIGEGQQAAAFSTGRSDNSVQLRGYAAWQALESVALTVQAQSQQRLQREGVSDWQMQAGVKISF